ncbi:MAG: YraN family protein [Nitrospira sp.]|nr:YraN family protein [Nitrospira sp.]
MTHHNKSLGKIGEDIAADFLKGKGYGIMEKNCRNRYGEIDLLCEQDGKLVFVEVKTRIGEQFGSPEDAINKDKINRLIKNSRAYMSYKAKNANILYRIDAVCIVLDNSNNLVRINHYENITM